MNIPTIEDDQPYNPFTEIRVLLGHQDIVNIIKIIDDTRFDDFHGYIVFKLVTAKRYPPYTMLF